MTARSPARVAPRLLTKAEAAIEEQKRKGEKDMIKTDVLIENCMLGYMRMRTSEVNATWARVEFGDLGFMELPPGSHIGELIIAPRARSGFTYAVMPSTGWRSKLLRWIGAHPMLSKGYWDGVYASKDTPEDIKP